MRSRHVMLACFALLALGAVTRGTSASAQETSDEIKRVGTRLHAILRPLRSLPDDAPAADRLRVLESSQSQLAQLRAAVLRLPNRLAGPRDRIRFHLDYLIKWNRYLIEQAGGSVASDAERDRERAKARYRAAQTALAQARAFERANPADRLAIADRYLKVLARLRGTPEERWIVDRLNRLWAEVSPPGASGASDNPVAKAPTSTEPPTKEPGGGAKPTPTAPDDGPLDAAALKALRAQAADGTATERLAALTRIAAQKRAWASTFLVGRLGAETDPAVRGSLEALVRQRGDRATLRGLARWARKKDPEDRKRAIALIAQIDHKDAGKTLADFAKEKTGGVVTALIAAAASMPDGRGVVVLAKLMKRRPELRSELITKLGDVGHPDAAKPLLSFLHRRKFPDLKSSATKAFRKLGVHGIPTLIGALDGRDYRQYAASTLRTVTGQRFGMNRSRWEGWWRKNRARLLGEAAANPGKQR